MHFKICPLLFSFYFLVEVWSEIIYLEQIKECGNLFKKIKITQENVDNLLDKWKIEEKFIFNSSVDEPQGFRFDSKKNEENIINIEEMDPQEMKNFLIHVTKNSKVKEDSQDKSFTLEQLEEAIEDILSHDEDQDGLFTSIEVEDFLKETKVFEFTEESKEEIRDYMCFLDCTYVNLPELLGLVLPKFNVNVKKSTEVKVEGGVEELSPPTSEDNQKETPLTNSS